jgi:hypothetical protein
VREDDRVALLGERADLGGQVQTHGRSVPGAGWVCKKRGSRARGQGVERQAASGRLLI